MSQTSYEIARRRVASFLCEQYGIVNQWRWPLEDMVIAAIDEAEGDLLDRLIHNEVERRRLLKAISDKMTDSPVSQDKMSEEDRRSVDEQAAKSRAYFEGQSEPEGIIDQPHSCDGGADWSGEDLDSIRPAAEAMASQEGMGQS